MDQRNIHCIYKHTHTHKHDQPKYTKKKPTDHYIKVVPIDRSIDR